MNPRIQHFSRRIVSPVALFVRFAAIFCPLLASAVCQAQQDALTSCLSGLENDARFAAVAGRIALGARADATPQMLVDRSAPAGRQVQAIAEWIAARSECARAEAAFGNAGYRPPLLAYRLEAEGRVIEAAADLHDRTMSFASFNRRRQEIAAELRGRIDDLSRQIQSQRAAMAQADREARERQQAQRSLEEAERQAALARQEADLARQQADRAQRPASRPAAPAESYRMRRPRIAGPVPYASCFQLDGRIICTYR